MAEIIYMLCMCTSLICMVLLWKSYRRSGAPLLFWSGICFLGLALNNVLLFLDLILMPDFDLSMIRVIPAFLGLASLVYGLIEELV